MGNLSVLDPGRARQVWESMSNPSSRHVATRLRQAGMTTSHETINRWRRGGWRRVERAQHPLEVAREALDDAVPVLTRDPMTTAGTLVEHSAERENLEKLTDAELLQTASRELARAVMMVAHAMLRQPTLVITKPAEVGFLLKALAACAQAAGAGFAQALMMQATAHEPRNPSARTGAEHDPLADALRSRMDRTGL